MTKVDGKAFAHFIKQIACDPISVVADHTDPQQLVYLDRFTHERIAYSCIYFQDIDKEIEYYILEDYYDDEE